MEHSEIWELPPETTAIATGGINEWCHVLSNRSPDASYGTQLFLGMSGSFVGYRRYSGGSYQPFTRLVERNWFSLDGTTLTINLP